jgi:putative membrane protein
MHYYNGDVGFWGMHMFWWIFWLMLIIGGTSFFEPVRRTRNRDHRASALEILQKRYANGDLSHEEYEKRKSHLERDGAKPDLTETRKA